MHLTVNGKAHESQQDTTIERLIQELGLSPELTAVQLNEHILDKKVLATTTLSEGDVVEFIRVVGGG